MSQLKKQVLTGVKWTGIWSIVTAVIQLVQMIILTRLLSPVEYGLMAIVAVIIGFAQIFGDLGLSNMIIHKQNITDSELSSIYWLNFMMSLALFACLEALSPLITMLYKEPRLLGMLDLYAFMFLVTPFGQLYQNIMQKEFHFKPIAKIEMSAFVVGVCITISFALMDKGAYSFIWGQLSCAAIKSLLLMKVGWKHWKPNLVFRIKHIRAFSKFGTYQLGERSLGYLIERMDQFLIGFFFGVSALGHYSLAYNLVVQPTMLINSVITRVAFPLFSRIQDDVSKLRKGYLNVLKAVTTVNAPMMLGLAVVAPILIPILLGDSWKESVALIQGLAIVSLLRSTIHPTESLLLSQGRADLRFKWQLGLFFISPMTILAGSRFGLNGVVYAQMLVHVFYSFMAYRFLIRPVLRSCGKDYFVTIARSYAMSAVMSLIVSVFISFSIVRNEIASVALDIAVGFVSYAFMLVLLEHKHYGDAKNRVMELRGR